MLLSYSSLKDFSYFNQTFANLGTVHGAGYDCRTGLVLDFEGRTDGMWNKVSQTFDFMLLWISFARFLTAGFLLHRLDRRDDPKEVDGNDRGRKDFTSFPEKD